MSFFYKALFISLLVFTFPGYSFGQAYLENLSSFAHNSEIEINWKFQGNVNQNVKRINVQRAADSTSYFSTIGSADRPHLVINKYLDKEPLKDSGYYRLFILFKDGSYAFSKTIQSIPIPDIPKGLDESVYDQTLLNNYFQPSFYVYTNESGNINIRLPKVKENNYTVRFYNLQDQFLFELKNVKKTFLILDKANFLHSGWFHYKIYKNRHIFEKWKFFIPDQIR